MKSMFNENMTYPEAQSVLFSAVEGKSDQEKKRIFDEYKAVLPAITKKEFKEPFWTMTSYKI